MSYIVFKPGQCDILTAQGGVHFEEWNQVFTKHHLFGNIAVVLAGCVLEDYGFTNENCEIYLAVIAGDGSISQGERVARDSI